MMIWTPWAASHTTYVAGGLTLRLYLDGDVDDGSVGIWIVK